MRKRAKNLYPEITSFEQLRDSAKLARKGVHLNRSLLSFWSELESNILLLQSELQNFTYQPSDYTQFMLLDPKPRRIQAASFEDRVVHHSLCYSLAPYFERSYLAHSFACQKGKGNHRAVNQAQKFTRRFQNGYCLKLDIKHCFETIDHQILLQKIEKKIACSPTLWLCERVISHGGIDGKGLPIGNLTSQHFANFYLDSLDHYCVEQLKVKGFIRYMDDLLLFSDCKDHLSEVLGELTLYVPKSLRLELKHSSTQLMPIYHGIPFLGFRVFPQCIRFDGRRKKRFIKKWKKLERLPEQEQGIRYNSLVAWAEQANTRQLRKNLLSGNGLQS